MWPALIPLIVRYGIPGAYEVWKIISKHPEPTEAAWQELLALNAKTDAQYLAEAEARKAVV
jgi:hypothetical protein